VIFNTPLKRFIICVMLSVFWIVFIGFIAATSKITTLESYLGGLCAIAFVWVVWSGYGPKLPSKEKKIV